GPAQALGQAVGQQALPAAGQEGDGAADDFGDLPGGQVVHGVPGSGGSAGGGRSTPGGGRGGSAVAGGGPKKAPPGPSRPGGGGKAPAPGGAGGAGQISLTPRGGAVDCGRFLRRRGRSRDRPRAHGPGALCCAPAGRVVQ